MQLGLIVIYRLRMGLAANLENCGKIYIAFKRPNLVCGEGKNEKVI